MKMTKRLFTILLLLLAIATRGHCQQISYIEETKNWYYVYDEQGKRIGGLARSSVGKLKAGAATSSCQSAIPTIISAMPRERRWKQWVFRTLVRLLVSPTAPSPVAKAVGYSHGTKRERKSVQEVPSERYKNTEHWHATRDRDLSFFDNYFFDNYDKSSNFAG